MYKYFDVREGTVGGERVRQPVIRALPRALLLTWYSVSLRKRTPQVGIHCEIRCCSPVQDWSALAGLPG
jgi:hypothetical protein